MAMATTKMASNDENLSSADFYKSIFNNMLDGLAYCRMVFDKQGNPVDFIYLKVNKNFEKLTGLKRAEGKKVTQLIPGIHESNPELFEIYGRVSRNGKPEKFEIYVAPLSRWFLISVYCPKNKYFVSIFQDTTTSKQVLKDLEDAKVAARNVLEDLQVEKETLALANAKDEALLASIADGVISTDRDGRIILMNQAAQKMLGRKFLEVQGKFVFDAIPILGDQGNLIPRNKRPLHLALSGTTSTTNHTSIPTYYYMFRRGKKFPVAIKASPVILENKIIGTVEVFRDITHETEVDRAKSEFVSLASHQLRTPLGITKWYLEVLQKDTYIKSAPKKIQTYFNQLATSNERVLSLVSELLSVSRIEEGRVKNSPKPINVAETVNDIIVEMQPLAHNKKIDLHLEMRQPNLPNMNIDPLRFHEVIENLVTNAVDYTPSFGKVYITIDTKDDTVLIMIKDTGIGMSEADQKRLFTKFFRSQKATETNPEGSGLGLYVAKSYVEGWRGRLTVKSREGKGSTFLISLPINRAKNGGGNS